MHALVLSGPDHTIVPASLRGSYALDKFRGSGYLYRSSLYLRIFFCRISFKMSFVIKLLNISNSELINERRQFLPFSYLVKCSSST